VSGQHANSYLVSGSSVLQLLVATNHVVAAIQGHALLNTIMGAVNYGCVVLGILALRGPTSRTSSSR